MKLKEKVKQVYYQQIMEHEAKKKLSVEMSAVRPALLNP